MKKQSLTYLTIFFHFLVFFILGCLWDWRGFTRHIFHKKSKGRLWKVWKLGKINDRHESLFLFLFLTGHTSESATSSKKYIQRTLRSHAQDTQHTRKVFCPAFFSCLALLSTNFFIPSLPSPWEREAVAVNKKQRVKAASVHVTRVVQRRVKTLTFSLRRFELPFHSCTKEGEREREYSVNNVLWNDIGRQMSFHSCVGSHACERNSLLFQYNIPWEERKSLRTVSLSPLKFLDFFYRWKKTGRGRKYLFSQDRNEGNSTRRLETRCIAFLFLESERRQQPVIQPARVCSYSPSVECIPLLQRKKSVIADFFLWVSLFFCPLSLLSLRDGCICW